MASHGSLRQLDVQVGSRGPTGPNPPGPEQKLPPAAVDVAPGQRLPGAHHQLLHRRLEIEPWPQPEGDRTGALSAPVQQRQRNRLHRA